MSDRPPPSCITNFFRWTSQNLRKGKDGFVVCMITLIATSFLIIWNKGGAGAWSPGQSYEEFLKLNTLSIAGLALTICTAAIFGILGIHLSDPDNVDMQRFVGLGSILAIQPFVGIFWWYTFSRIIQSGWEGFMAEHYVALGSMLSCIVFSMIIGYFASNPGIYRQKIEDRLRRDVSAERKYLSKIFTPSLSNERAIWKLRFFRATSVYCVPFVIFSILAYLLDAFHRFALKDSILNGNILGKLIVIVVAVWAVSAAISLIFASVMESDRDRLPIILHAGAIWSLHSILLVGALSGASLFDNYGESIALMELSLIVVGPIASALVTVSMYSAGHRGPWFRGAMRDVALSRRWNFLSDRYDLPPGAEICSNCQGAGYVKP